MGSKIYVKVMDAPFNAKGDGVTNDRESIQKAIDYVYSQGGGTVELNAHKTFLTSGIVLRSNVELHFGTHAIIHQSPNKDEYVKPVKDGYEPYTPILGHNFSPTIRWSHCWYKNYPFIYAPEGSSFFKITGEGTIRMMDVECDPEEIIKICPIGFYRCTDFVIDEIRIVNYHSYAIMPFTCKRGLFKNIKIYDYCYGNGDGICLMNCQDIRITECNMITGDDSVYIFSSYKDPRKSEWWNSDTPQASKNIEIDHNKLFSNHCKAFGMILWGKGCPNKEDIEVRNVYVHDNHIETMGNWLFDPYTDKKGNPPVTTFRFENNVIDGIQINFFETAISDMNYYKSMAMIENGEFGDGLCFWATKEPYENSVGTVREEGKPSYAYMKNFDKGDVRLYQGLYMTKENGHGFRAKILAPGKVKMFIRNLDTDELVASKEVQSTKIEEFFFTFNVPQDGNYHIGFESANNEPGEVEIYAAWVCNHERATHYKEAYNDNGIPTFKVNDDLYNNRDVHRDQLKMYWFTDGDLPELTLPEGYSFSNYKDENDIHDWYASICTDVIGDKETELAMFKREIIDFVDLNETEDTWFLDYNGEHIGTATSFVHKETGSGDMHWVGIKKEFRGKGLAKYLSYKVQKTLKDRGVPFVSLTTGEGRPAACRSYLKAGFIPVEYSWGMRKRWEAVLEANDIDSVEMVDENANPLPSIYRTSIVEKNNK